jgi:hypothetical protein
MKQFKYKIFTFLPPRGAIDVIPDWQGEDYPQFQITDNLQECLDQPYRVAAVPAMFNQPGGYAYNKELCDIDWSKFDLVILSDIEYTDNDLILNYCIKRSGIKNYLIALGGIKDDVVDSNFIYRPWWMFQHMRLNQYQEVGHENKLYKFDALLGARKAHRSYVMARFQNNQELLDNSIVTYRDIFHGPGDNWISDLDPGRNNSIIKEANDIANNKIAWPYVSPNMNPDWEVAKQLYREISEITPWNIYKHTWFSICCETLYSNPAPTAKDRPGPHFITEKTTKLLLAKRLFVMFGPMHTLKFLKSLGFQTFESVIDESYDDCDNALERFKRAFDQVEYLASLSPACVLEMTKDIREHNHNHLYTYRKQIKNKMHQMILDKIPEQHKFD